MSEIRAGGIRVDVGLRLQNFERDVAQLAKELNKVKKSFLDLGKNLSVTLTAPLAAIGAASFAAAKSYSSAFKQIERTTGATGDVLKRLEQSFRTVYTSANRNAGDTALALTRVAVETGATDKILEDLTRTILNLSTITESDLLGTLDSTTGVLDNWSISTSDATAALNVLYGVSQKTGVGVNDLADKLRVGGPTLRAFGLSFEDAATMVGLLADKGLDVERFFSSLDKLPKKIKDTHDLGAAFDALIASAGGDGADLLGDVIQGFGAKGATGFVEALKLMRSQFESTKESILSSGADINKTMETTAGIGDKLQNLKNILTDALVPIGNIIASAIKPSLEAVKPYLESFAVWLSTINPSVLKWGVGLLAVVAAAGPFVMALGGLVAAARNLVLLGPMIVRVFSVISFAVALPVLKFAALAAIIYVLVETVRRSAPVFEAVITAMFHSGVISLLEFELALRKLDVVIAEWVESASANFRQFWNNTALGFAKIKETLGLAEEGFARSVFDSQDKSAPPSTRSEAATASVVELQKRLTMAHADLDSANVGVTRSLSEFGDSMTDLFSPITNLISGEETLATTADKTAPKALELGKRLLGIGQGGKEGVTGLNSFNGYLKTTEEQTNRAAEAVENLRDRLAQTTNQAATSRLRDSLTEALSLDTIDVSAFDALKNSYLTSVRDGILLGMKDSVAQAGAEGEILAQKIAAEEVTSERIRLEEELATKLKDSHKKAYEESVQFWRSTFENAITGETFNLADTLKQVAVGFGADLAAGLSQGVAGGSGLLSSIMTGSKSPQDIGANLAKYLFGGADGAKGIFSNIGFGSFEDFFGGKQVISPDGSATRMGGLSDAIGQLTSDVFAGANTMSAYVSAALASVGSLRKLTQGTQQAADGLTEIGMSVAGAAFGGPVGGMLGKLIGDKVGDWVGGQFSPRRDPGSIARHDATGKLEDLIAKVGGLQYFDTGGKMHNVSNIELGSSDRFNGTDWAGDMFATFGDQATQAFVGVGTALTELLGITEDVGGQIGNILIEQFNGDTEALKALVQTAGLTYDQFVDSLIARGKEGQETWLAIISEVNAGAEAFQEGLTGSGKYLQAFENLLNTAGRGQIALNQVRNLAVESAEASISTLDQLRNMLAESGQFTEQEVNALFSAFNTVGITGLDQLRNATDLQLAQVVASMDAYFADHGSKWSLAAAEVQKYDDQLAKLSGRKVDIDINLHTHFDDATNDAIQQGLLDSQDVSADTTIQPTTSSPVKKFALGGVLNAPTFVAPGTLAGEAGIEGIFPLKRMKNGELGIRADVGSSHSFAGGVTINVDARGAEAGVEQRLGAMFSHMEDRIVERSISIILDSAQRGGLRGYL